LRELLDRTLTAGQKQRLAELERVLNSNLRAHEAMRSIADLNDGNWRQSDSGTKKYTMAGEMWKLERDMKVFAADSLQVVAEALMPLDSGPVFRDRLDVYAHDLREWLLAKVNEKDLLLFNKADIDEAVDAEVSRHVRRVRSESPPPWRPVGEQAPEVRPGAGAPAAQSWVAPGKPHEAAGLHDNKTLETTERTGLIMDLILEHPDFPLKGYVRSDLTGKVDALEKAYAAATRSYGIIEWAALETLGEAGYKSHQLAQTEKRKAAVVQNFSAVFFVHLDAHMYVHKGYGAALTILRWLYSGLLEKTFYEKWPHTLESRDAELTRFRSEIQAAIRKSAEWAAFTRHLESTAEKEGVAVSAGSFVFENMITDTTSGHGADNLPADGILKAKEPPTGKRGAPTKIPIARKRAALAVKDAGGSYKDAAKKLYDTLRPTPQQVKNASKHIATLRKDRHQPKGKPTE
jgi:hypothetical protein